MRVVGRIKSPNNFRNRSKGLPLWGDSMPKSGNFQTLGSCSHPVPIGAKYWTAKRTPVPLGPVEFMWIGATSRPYGVEMPIFSLSVNFITGCAALRRPAGKLEPKSIPSKAMLAVWLVVRTNLFVPSRFGLPIRNLTITVEARRTAPNFHNLLHTPPQCDTERPNFARWSNWTIGKFYTYDIASLGPDARFVCGG